MVSAAYTVGRREFHSVRIPLSANFSVSLMHLHRGLGTGSSNAVHRGASHNTTASTACRTHALASVLTYSCSCPSVERSKECRKYNTRWKLMVGIHQRQPYTECSPHNADGAAQNMICPCQSVNPIAQISRKSYWPISLPGIPLVVFPG